MSTIKQQINTEADSGSPFRVREDCVGSHFPTQSPSPSLKQLIENELAGASLRDQKKSLRLLLLRLAGSASHQHTI